MSSPRHVLLELDDDGDLQTVDDDDRSVSSEALGISSSATSFSEDGAEDKPGRRRAPRATRAKDAEEAPPRGVGRRQRAGARSYGGLE